MSTDGFFFYLPVTVSLVFGFLLLFKQERHGFSAKVMGTAMLLYAVVLGLLCIYRGTDYAPHYYLDILYSFIGLIFVPVTVAYFCVLTENRLSLRVLLLLFAPPLAIGCLIGALYASLGHELAEQYFRNTYYRIGEPASESWNYRLLRFFAYSAFNYLLVIQLICGTVYVQVLLRKYNRRLREYYSNTDDKDERRNYFVSWALVLWLAIALVHTLWFGATSRQSAVVIDLLYCFYAVILFVIGRSVLNVTYTAADLEYFQLHSAAEAVPVAVAGDPISPTVLNERIQRLFDAERLYLRPDLTLDELAVRSGTDCSRLSVFFNEVYGIPFYDYINLLRIAVAEPLLADEQNGDSFEWIASRSGFVSAASFARTFKAVKGVAPDVWRRQSAEENKNLRNG